MRGGCNFKELEAFQKKLGAVTDNMESISEECLKDLTARFLAKVIKRTPVGKKPKLGPKSAKVKGSSGKSRAFLTREGAILQQYWSGYQGGTLRRGWTSRSEQEAKSGKGKPDIERFVQTASIRHSGGMYSIEIKNPVHYASYVEHGHRQSPGRYVPALGVQLKDAWVPGKFMMTISEQEIQRDAPGIIARKLKKLMEAQLK